MTGEQLRDTRPQLEHGRDLLERDPPRLQRECESQRLDGQQRAWITALLQPLRPAVMTRGQLVRARGDYGPVSATQAPTRGRIRLAWRGTDQPPRRREVIRLQSRDVGLKALVARGTRGLTRPAVALDTERAQAEPP